MFKLSTKIYMLLVDDTLDGETPHVFLYIQTEFDPSVLNVLLLGSFSTIIVGSKELMGVHVFIFYVFYC